jgi:hypothetical protein
VRPLPRLACRFECFGIHVGNYGVERPVQILWPKNIQVLVREYSLPTRASAISAPSLAPFPYANILTTSSASVSADTIEIAWPFCSPPLLVTSTALRKNAKTPGIGDEVGLTDCTISTSLNCLSRRKVHSSSSFSIVAGAFTETKTLKRHWRRRTRSGCFLLPEDGLGQNNRQKNRRDSVSLYPSI